MLIFISAEIEMGLSDSVMFYLNIIKHSSIGETDINVSTKSMNITLWGNVESGRIEQIISYIISYIWVRSDEQEI